MQLKCTIVIYNIVHLGYKFLCDFIQQNTRFGFSKKFSKNCDNSALLSAPYYATCTQNQRLLFLICILYINFCAISSLRNRDQRIPEISEKVKLQLHLLSDFHQKLIDFNLRLDNMKHKVSLNALDQFLSNTCHKIFLSLSHTHTDILQKYSNRG